MTVLESNGWDRNTRKPAQMPPPGSWDCAVHVYGPPGSSTLAASRAYEPPEATFDDVLRVHRTLGIERGVIVQPTAYGSDHSVLLEALVRAGGAYLATGIIDETVSDAELERLGKAGVRGARFNFYSILKQDWTNEKFERQAARIAELGWITVVHGTADELLERETMLRKVRTPLLIDHMCHWDLSKGYAGNPAFEFLCDLLREGNAWMKLSNGDRFSLQGPPYDDVIALARAFIAVAPERMIWATDWPHIMYKGKAPNDAELLELLFRFAPDAALRKAILVDNPARLYES